MLDGRKGLQFLVDSQNQNTPVAIADQVLSTGALLQSRPLFFSARRTRESILVDGGCFSHVPVTLPFDSFRSILPARAMTKGVVLCRKDGYPQLNKWLLTF